MGGFALFDFKPRTATKPAQHHRVSLTCEIETPTGKQHIELPFTVGVLGNFSGSASTEPDVVTSKKEPLTSRHFINVGRDRINDVMTAVRPELSFTVKHHLHDDRELPVTLQFDSMADFSPASIVRQVPLLSRLRQLRADFSDIRQSPDRVERLQYLLKELQQQEPELLEYLKNKGSGL